MHLTLYFIVSSLGQGYINLFPRILVFIEQMGLNNKGQHFGLDETSILAKYGLLKPQDPSVKFNFLLFRDIF